MGLSILQTLWGFGLQLVLKPPGGGIPWPKTPNQKLKNSLPEFMAFKRTFWVRTLVAKIKRAGLPFLGPVHSSWITNMSLQRPADSLGSLDSLV